MRILIYGINYAPELTGIGKYSGEMGAWLAQNNHEVDVITAHAYYPEWQIHSTYKGKYWHSEYIQGVKVSRSPLYVPKNVTSLKRILHEISFLTNSFPYWIKALYKRRYDVIICVVPAFHLGFPALMYSKLRHVPLIYHIQDLQVDAAKDLGMIKNNKLLSLLFKAEKFILDNCTKISTISEGMLRKIYSKGVSHQKCILFPNWVDENYIKPLPKEKSLRSEFGLSMTDKVVMYSGNLGEKQGIESIIEVARLMNSWKNLYFLIVGSGGAKYKLEELVRSYQLKNVKFFPLQPYEKLSAALATADIHLVLQKKSASDLVMPSKLTSILASGGCALVTAPPNSTLYQVVTKHQVGLLVEPESVDALRAGIEKALTDDVTVYRKNARMYAEKYLSRENVLREYEQAIRLLVKQPSYTNELNENLYA